MRSLEEAARLAEENEEDLKRIGYRMTPSRSDPMLYQLYQILPVLYDLGLISVSLLSSEQKEYYYRDEEYYASEDEEEI